MLGIGLWALMLAGSGAVHYYLWIRLVRDTTKPRTTGRRLATWGVVLSALLAPGTRMLTPLFDPSDGGGGRFLAWPGYTLIGVLLYLLMVLAVLELPRALLLRRWRRNAGQQDEPAPVRVPVAAAAPDAAAVPAAAEAAPAAPGRKTNGCSAAACSSAGPWAPWPGPPPSARSATACPPRSATRWSSACRSPSPR